MLATTVIGTDSPVPTRCQALVPTGTEKEASKRAQSSVVEELRRHGQTMTGKNIIGETKPGTAKHKKRISPSLSVENMESCRATRSIAAHGKSEFFIT